MKLKNQKKTYLNSTRISCRYLGDLHTEAKHSIFGSFLNTDAPKDHDGNGESFATTDLLASALGTCLITIMAIVAKRRGWNLGEIKIEVYKTMTSSDPRKIKSLFLENFMPSDLGFRKLKALKNIADQCPVKLKLQ